MVQCCQESSLTVNEWCNQNGIKPTCYYYRLSLLRKALLEQYSLVPSADQTTAMPTLVKIDMTAATQEQLLSSEASCERSIRLHYGSAVLDIRVGTCADDIAEVFKAMVQYAS